MKSPILYLIFTILLITSGCKPDLESENVKLREDVIAVHDEVMPLMSRLKSFENQAEKEILEISEADEIDSVRIETLKSLSYDLEQAYEGMFVWMRQYDNNNESQRSPEELKVYLHEQMDMVKEVNSEIKTVLAKAENEIKE